MLYSTQIYITAQILISLSLFFRCPSWHTETLWSWWQRSRLVANRL